MVNLKRWFQNLKGTKPEVKAKERKVRLFISSTFIDMNDERDHLNMFVFPRIKEYCKVRLIDFTAVDLRWGITEEQSNEGLVLASCMEEIDNSRPFFVGLLGNRYGSSPTMKDLSNSRPCITENRDWLETKVKESSSITEIEIEYALLKNSSMQNAIFFIRTEDNATSKDQDNQDPIRSNKLAELKSKIKAQSKYPVFSYSSVDELGDILYQRVIEAIKEEFPDDENNYLNSVDGRHEASLDRQAFTFFEDPNVKPNFKHWEKGGFKTLLVTGPSGSGTSNELANMTKYIRDQYPDNYILYYDFEMADPNVNLMDDFLKYIELHKSQLSTKHWSHISIDNASLLGLKDIDRLIKWIREKPANLHTIIAASYSYFTEAISFVQHSIVTLQGWPQYIQKEVIQKFCKRYGKHLTDKQITSLLNGKHSNDPTILMILLNTIINFGYMEQLDERIDYLVKESNFTIFRTLVKEYDKLYYHKCAVDFWPISCMAVAMHESAGGISEENIQAAFELPMAQWAIVRPAILQFCHGNSKSLTFIRRSWAQDVKNNYNTPLINYVGCKFIDWWQTQLSKNMYVAAKSILSIYLYIWHLPFKDDKTENRIKGIVLGVLRSPDTVMILPSQLLANAWRFFKKYTFSSNNARIIGRSVEELTFEFKVKYYKKLLTVSETNSRIEDSKWGYQHLACLYDGQPLSIIYDMYALMAEGLAEKALATIESIDLNKCSYKDYLQIMVLKAKAHIMQNNMGLAINQVMEIFNYGEKYNSSIDDEDKGLVASICAYFGANMFMTMDVRPLSPILKAFYKVTKEYISTKAGCFTEINFNCLLAQTYINFQFKDWEQMHICAKLALTAAYFYGSSFHFGRAHLLANYAYKKWKGVYWANESVYTNTFRAYNYLQSINPDVADKNVTDKINFENDFFKKLHDEIGGGPMF